MRDYLVYCTYCSSYTLLHSFDKDSGSFLGNIPPAQRLHAKQCRAEQIPALSPRSYHPLDSFQNGRLSKHHLYGLPFSRE